MNIIADDFEFKWNVNSNQWSIVEEANIVACLKSLYQTYNKKVLLISNNDAL